MPSSFGIVMSNHIIIGSRVEGPYGPLVPNPDPNKKRRVRSRVVGTVLKASAQHKWEVQFNFDGKVQECSSKCLKVVCAEAGVPVNEIARYHEACQRNMLIRNTIMMNGDSATATISTMVR